MDSSNHIVLHVAYMCYMKWQLINKVIYKEIKICAEMDSSA